MTDIIYTSPSYRDMFDKILYGQEPTMPARLFGGVPICTSSLFPFTQACSKCAGTGSGGEEATYCPKCKGGGKITYVGLMTQQVDIFVLGYDTARTVFMVEYGLPLFQPSFPFPVPLRDVSYTRC